MIEIKNLHKTYKTPSGDVEALKGINLNIKDGEIYGIIGLSGAGKSSLVRCINLLENPTSGEILVDGVNLAGLSGSELRNSRKKIGMIFQHFNLLMSKTVYENIAFPMKISKFSKEEIQIRVAELLELVGLSDKKDMYPAQLSGGQKQRIGIARAIAAKPSLIMCDEATSALDPTTTKSILQLLKEVNKKLGITIVLITHEMEVIKTICHKVAIMEYGKIIESGTVSSVLTNPKTNTAREFFGVIDLKSRNKLFENYADNKGVLVNATFEGDKTSQPFISEMIKTHDVEVSILMGNIQEISNDLIGNLVIKIEGTSENVKSAIEYLQEKEIQVEVINDAK